MIKIEDRRGTGRTTRLLILCAERRWIFVSPTNKSAEYAAEIARKYNLQVEIITAYDFFSPLCDRTNKHYMIDDLDNILAMRNVTGYSICRED